MIFKSFFALAVGALLCIALWGHHIRALVAIDAFAAITLVWCGSVAFVFSIYDWWERRIRADERRNVAKERGDL